jgi:uncharacterized membrane protein
MVILTLLISIKNTLSSKFTLLQQKVDLLTEELKRMRRTTPEEKAVQRSPLEEALVPHAAPVAKPQPVPPPVQQKEQEVKPKEVAVPKEVVRAEVITPPERTAKPTAPSVPKPRKPGFFERNPDLEKFIGENLANKIGIGILVLGIGFFVKYAIDKDWINEIGRVFIGILCGGILLGVAHRLRKTFAAFSSVLVGGGIAILYLTIAIAFHEYQLFPQTAAFILMVVITGFTIVLSLGYNRIELAILAILGGFASPFMVSTGEGNYVVLFSYILILDVGMLVLAYYKKWNLINIISYAFTLILFYSWLGGRFDGENPSMIAGALIFATLFYLVFFAMNIVNNIKERTQFKAIEISLLLSNTFLYYAAGMVILNNAYGSDFKGLFTAALGVFNFVFAFTLYKNVRIDRNLVFLLIGLVLTFISLAAPVQLEGNYITLFWAAETVLLLWLSQKSGIALMKLASVVVLVLMVVSLLMDWEQLYLQATYDGPGLRVIFNKAYITGIVAMVSMGATFILLKNERGAYAQYVAPYRTILTVPGIVLLYISQFLELQYHVYRYTDSYATQSLIIGSYNMLFILGLLFVGKKLTIPEPVKKAFAGWGIVAILIYFTFYHQVTTYARNHYLTGDATATGFIFHYVLVVLLLVIAVVSLRRLRALAEANPNTHHLYSWFYVFFFVFIASAELDHIILLIAYSGIDSIDPILTQNHKIGFPILWGLASFILISVGLKRKQKHLRIISLTLFLVTLLKLFLLDIRGISEGGKIAAFISLGVLLLVVSFMYQRLKKLLLADEPAVTIPDTEKQDPI